MTFLQLWPPQPVQNPISPFWPLLIKVDIFIISSASFIWAYLCRKIEKHFTWIKNVKSVLLEGLRVFIWDQPTGGHWEQQGSICWWLHGGWTVINIISRAGWGVARSCLPHWCFWDPSGCRLLYWHLKFSFFLHVVCFSYWVSLRSQPVYDFLLTKKAAQNAEPCFSSPLFTSCCCSWK